MIRLIITANTKLIASSHVVVNRRIAHVIYSGAIYLFITLCADAFKPVFAVKIKQNVTGGCDRPWLAAFGRPCASQLGASGAAPAAWPQGEVGGRKLRAEADGGRERAVGSSG